MKPTNLIDKNCTLQSSDCVVYDGRDLKSVGICKGQSVSVSIYKLAKHIETLEDTLNIENYTLGCLTDVGAIADFKGLLQNLITKVCTP